MIWILIGALVGFVAAVALGADWSGLANVRWRLAWLCLLGLAIRLVLFSGPEDLVRWLLPAAPALHVLSTVLVVASLAANWRTPGFAVIALGALLNLAAIVANGGQMPTFHQPKPAVFSNVAQFGDQTRLAVLGDWIELPFLPNRGFSIGDCFIAAGSGWAVYRLLRVRRPMHVAGVPSPFDA
jgi:hypothetical protein